MKSILVVAGIVLSLSVHAQKHLLELLYKPGLAYLGPQQQQFGQEQFVSGSGKNTVTQGINITYRHQVSPALAISGGIEWVQQGQRFNFKRNPLWQGLRPLEVLTTELNYVRFPISVTYAVLHGRKSSLSVFTGISLGLAVKRSDNYQQIIVERILLPAAGKRYSSTDWAVPIGMRYQLEAAKNLVAIAGIEYQLGLTNSFDPSSAFGVLRKFDHARLSRLAMNIGIGYQFGRK